MELHRFFALFWHFCFLTIKINMYYKNRVHLFQRVCLFTTIEQMSTWYLHICILGSTIYDPETLSFSNIGTTTCSHQGSGCALFYSPRHKNRPTVFIGGSNDTTFDVCAEVLDYTVNNNTWKERMFRSYKMVFYHI